MERFLEHYQISNMIGNTSETDFPDIYLLRDMQVSNLLQIFCKSFLWDYKSSKT